MDMSFLPSLHNPPRRPPLLHATTCPLLRSLPLPICRSNGRLPAFAPSHCTAGFRALGRTPLFPETPGAAPPRVSLPCGHPAGFLGFPLFLLLFPNPTTVVCNLAAQENHLNAVLKIQTPGPHPDQYIPSLRTWVRAAPAPADQSTLPAPERVSTRVSLKK